MSATRPDQPATNPPPFGPQKYLAEKHATSPAPAQRESSSAGSSGTPRQRRLARPRSPPAARASRSRARRRRGGRGAGSRGRAPGAPSAAGDVVRELHPRARQRRAARVLVLVPALHQHDGVRAAAARTPAVAARDAGRDRQRDPADAPGTTRAASLPHSAAIRAPDAASSSSIAAQVAFASSAAAHADGAEHRSAEVGVDPARVDHAANAQRVVERHPRHSERRRLRARRLATQGWRPPRRLWFPPR